MNQSITQWLEKYPQSTVEEMRAMRRELIADYITIPDFCLCKIKSFVRFAEIKWYGQELQAYA